MIAALRAWGAGRVVLLVGAVFVLIETTATDQVSLPPFTHDLNGWSFVPPVVAIVMAEPLVDRSTDLTLHATRRLSTIALARVGLAYAGGAAVAGYCLASAEGTYVAGYVLVFLAVGTVAVAALTTWFWVPLLALFVVWLQVAGTDFPRASSVIPAWQVLVAVVGSWLTYVGSVLLREEARLRSAR